MNKSPVTFRAQLPGDATLAAIERAATQGIKTAARRFNKKRPEVIVRASGEDKRCAQIALMVRREPTLVSNRPLRLPLTHQYHTPLVPPFPCSATIAGPVRAMLTCSPDVVVQTAGRLIGGMD